MKKEEKFVIAVKDTSVPGKIKPGRVLATFRKKEFADKAFSSTIRAAHFQGAHWNVGIFHQGQLAE